MVVTFCVPPKSSLYITSNSGAVDDAEHKRNAPEADETAVVENGSALPAGGQLRGGQRSALAVGTACPIGSAHACLQIRLSRALRLALLVDDLPHVLDHLRGLILHLVGDGGLVREIARIEHVVHLRTIL